MELLEAVGNLIWAADVEISGGHRTRTFKMQHRAKVRYWIDQVQRKIASVKPFPYRRDDYIQYVGGYGPVYIIRGVDDENQEAWAECVQGYGQSTRVINPENWKVVSKLEEAS